MSLKDIADQTNLLALNSAIEAERAGAQGNHLIPQKHASSAEEVTKAGASIDEVMGILNAIVDAVMKVNNQVTQIASSRERAVCGC